MKDKNFKIKIGDLLHNVGSYDDVHFEKKFLDDLQGLTEDGISGDVNLQSLNAQALYCILHDVNCHIVENCDGCMQSYVRKVEMSEYTAKFVLGDTKSYVSEKSDEEVFQIDDKAEFINIADMVKNAIILQEPIAKHCEDCQKKIDKMDDDEELPYFESKSNIIFEVGD